MLGTAQEGKALDIRGADVANENLDGLPLDGLKAGLSGADWRIVDETVPQAQTRESLYKAAAVTLRGATLVKTDLRGASLTYADLRSAKLSDSSLEGADLFRAILNGDPPANLHGATLDQSTRLNEVALTSEDGIGPRLFDVRWNGASLSGIDWSSLKKLADERRNVHKSRRRQGEGWGDFNRRRIIWYSEASQSYRQLSAALEEQGMNDHARRFLYRSEVARLWGLMHSLGHIRKWPAFIFSLLLGAISGWGYRIYRSMLLYIGTVFVFACLYRAALCDRSNCYSWREVLVLSVAEFHGRAFYPGGTQFGPETTFATIAASEAFVGLLIEAIVIATLTRRLFSE
jgi:hypothetical protein